MSKKKSSFMDSCMAGIIGIGVGLVLFEWYIVVGIIGLILLLVTGVFSNND